MRERMHQIARSLKELHLAATMEEALKRAKEIVESVKENGKPIRELMEDMKEEAKEQDRSAEHIQHESDKHRRELEGEAHGEEKQTEHSIASAKDTKTSAKSTEEQLNYDIKVHKLETSDVKEAMREVDELECATKDADYIVKEAEAVQKKSRKKK